MKFKISILFSSVFVFTLVGMFATANPVLASCDPTGNPPGTPPVISGISNPTGTYTDPVTIPVKITGEGGYICTGNPNGGIGYDDVSVTVSYDIKNNAGNIVYSGYWSARPCTVPICGARTIDVNQTVNSAVWPSGNYTIIAQAVSGGGLTDTASGTFSINRTVLMSGTLTPPASNCIIPSGQSTCTQTLSWTTTNPIGTSAVTNNGGATPNPKNGNDGSQLFIVKYNSNLEGVTTFYLYNNAVQLAVATVTTSCGGNSTWNGSTCSADAPPSGTISATSCTIPIGKDTCPSLVTWDTQNRLPGANTAVTRNNPDNTTVSSNTSGTDFSNDVNFGSSTFYLYHNNVKLAQATITATCDNGGQYNGNTCVDENGPIDGRWVTGNWGDCINGTRTRTVTCVGPYNGGNQCPTSPTPPYPPASTDNNCPAGPGPTTRTPAKCAANHNNCVVGNFRSGSNVNGISKWTWTCDSTNGGTSAMCTELKKKPVFIEN